MSDDTLNQPPEDPIAATPAPEAAPAPTGPPIQANANVAVGVSKGPAPTQQSTASVPSVTGMRQDEALTTLQNAGFEVQVLLNANASFANGKVSHQLPAANAMATKGAKAAIIVSNGPAAESAAVSVLPDVVGMSGDEAKSLLNRAQLKPAVFEDFSASVPAGVVLSQEPNARDLNRMPEKKSKAWLWILLLLVALVAGAFFLLTGGEEVEVPNLVGMTLEEAEVVLEDADFTVGKVTEEADAEIPEGQILSQDPAATEMANSGSRIDIVTAKVPEGVEVPDVTGKREGPAQSALEDVGLTVRVEQVYSDDVAEGQVVAQSPQAGTRVQEGTEVAVSVSQGEEPPPNATVPNAAGMTEAEATEALSAVDLSSQVVNSYSDGVPEGSVIAQAPASGSSVAPGTTVLLFVSEGPKPPDVIDVAVPDVEGMTQDDAETALSDAGFDIEVLELANETVESGLVFSQFPLAEAEAPEGSTVAILVSTGPAM